jgi:hypothetical protein
VYLAENRLGEMPFTVTNMTDQPLRGKVSVVPLDAAPPQWFSIVGKSEVDLQPRATAQILVQVEPPLGAAAATHQFRLDADDPGTPESATTGPSVEVVVPPSEPKWTWKKPRGYIATLLGATIGGAVGELVILVTYLTQQPEDKDCGGDFGCALGDAIGQVIILLLAILVGLGLLWVGSIIGAGASLRIKRYLGSKTTAVVLGILMIPWTIGVLWLLSKITDNLNIVVAMILAPILLTAVPGVLARGFVLRWKTGNF